MPEQSASLTIMLRAKDETEAAFARLRASMASLEGQVALLGREAELGGGRFRTLEGAAKGAGEGIGQTGAKVSEANGRLSSMAGTTSRTSAELTSVEQAASRAHPSITKVGHASKETEGHLGKLGEGAREAGVGIFGLEGTAKLAGAGIAIGLGGGIAASVEMASKFQQSTAQIAAQAGISQRAADGIGKAFLATAGQTTFSAQEMSAAFAPVAGQFVQMTGHALSAGDSLKVMKVAMDAAEATGQPLATTTKTLADVMQGFHIGVDGAARASDVLYNTARATGTSVDELSTAMLRLHSRLGDVSPSLGDTGTLMTALADNGIKGSRGVMVVNTAMSTLLGGSKTTSAELHALGLNVYDASGKFVGMQSVIAQLQPRLAKMTDEQRRTAEATLFGKATAEAMGGVIAAGAAKYAATSERITEMGSAHEAAEKRSATFEGALKRLQGAASSVAITIGTAVLPTVTQVASWFADKLPGALAAAQRWLDENRRGIEQFGHVVGTVVTTVLPVLIHVLGDVVAGLRFVTEHHALLYPLLVLIGAQLTFLALRWTVMKVAAVEAAVEAAVKAEANALRASAAWLASSARAIVGFAAQAAGATAAYTVMAAGAIATGATMAAAWLVGLGPIAWIIAGVVALGAVFVGLYTHVEGFRRVVDAVFSFVRNHIQAVMLVIITVLTGGLGLLVVLVVTHLSQIRGFFVAVWNAITGAVSAALGAIWTVITTVTGAIWGFISSVWNGMLGFFGSVLAGIVGTVVNGFNAVRNVIATVMGAVVGTIAAWLGSAVGWFAGLPGRILGAIGGLAGALMGAAGHAIGSMIGGLEGAVGGALGWFGGLGGRIFGAIGDLPGRAAGLGRDIIGRMADGISGAGHWFWDKLKGVLGGPIRAVPLVGGKVADALGLASGGLIKATPGGTLARIAEAGEDEFVIPASRARGIEDILLARLGMGGTLTTVTAPTMHLTSPAHAGGPVSVAQGTSITEVHTHVELDGREIATYVHRHVSQRLTQEAKLQGLHSGSNT